MLFFILISDFVAWTDRPRSKKGSIRLVVGIQMESDGKSSIDFLSLCPFISASESGTGRSQGFRLSKNKT